MAGRKIFVSYKYSDSNVQALPYVAGRYAITTSRHYVDLLQILLDADDHIYKGEDNEESLDEFKDSTIATKLRDKIYDSSVTIVMLSPGMRDPFTPEADQWIPWEVSQSLRELTRDERTSETNAMLAVALPDATGSYDYAVRHSTCPLCNCTTWQTHTFFEIIAKNMFNLRQPIQSACTGHSYGDRPHLGNNHSFIYPVKWSEFAANIGGCVDIACAIKGEVENYNLTKLP